MVCIMHTREILSKLISFDTVSANSNLELMTFVSDLLHMNGIKSELIFNEDSTKANLYATIGPSDIPGIMLSGHTDVVPVEGQKWSVPPFELTELKGRLYGRGTADMKGFIACSLAAALRASDTKLTTPLHLAYSYDEEIGCVGVRSMIDMLERAPVKPAMCIVGEPTNLGIAIGHKGKTGLRAICTGKEGHSALAPFAFNAIHLASDLVTVLRNLQSQFETSGHRDPDYDVPYTTIHVGRINGGTALNIVPNHCQVDFEIRNIADDDPWAILETIKSSAAEIVAEAQQQTPEANIQIEVFNTYPGLKTASDNEVVKFMHSLTGANTTHKVAFGTEGGLFSEQLGIPTIVCGPGSMEQGHKPDEFIDVEQLNRCDAILNKLIERLADSVLG